MRKILCPTDFSETAQNGIVYAAKFSHQIGATLTLFNVQSLFNINPLDIVQGKMLRMNAYKELLEQQSYEISSTFKISCYAEVQPSSTSLAKTIADKATGYDLIIMGTNGADDLFQFLSGSHTYNAVLKTNVPAILVHSGCMYSEIKNIVYAFDYLRDRNLPVQQLIPIVSKLEAQLTVLQVMEEAQSKELDDYLKELQDILHAEYDSAIRLNFDTIRSSSIAASIDNYIRKSEPDALAVCTVNRNVIQSLFHKSVIKSLSSISEYPVFVFHN